MNENIQELMPNIKIFLTYSKLKRFSLIFSLLSGLLLIPVQLTRSEDRSKEIFLKCIGKFEINRGELIKPDWETSYLTINLDGLKSTIVENGTKKQGKTLIRRDYYIITHKDVGNRINNIYTIHKTYGTYKIESPQRNKTLIGICQKGRG